MHGDSQRPRHGIQEGQLGSLQVRPSWIGDDKQTKGLARRAQDEARLGDRPVVRERGGLCLADGRLRDGRGRSDVIARMCLESKHAPGSQVDRNLRISQLRAERIDRHTTNCNRVGSAGTLSEPPEDAQLVVSTRRIRACERLLADRPLGQKPFDVPAPEAPVPARVNAVGREPARVGPGANRVGVNAKQRRCLGDADESALFAFSGSCLAGHLD